MPQHAASLTNRTLSGLFWTSLATGANFISLLVVLVVLARLLTPADFGLAAVALMVIGFSAIYSEFGVGPAVVQRGELRSAHLSTAFTLSVSLGVLLGALTWIAAPAVASFFQQDDLVPILQVMSLIFPVQALGVVADSLMQRELRFRALALLDVITFVLGYGAVGITLAFFDFAAWALVGAHMAQTSLRTVLLLSLRRHPVLPLLEKRACAELLRFGGGFTFARICNYLAGQGEHFVIGRCLGTIALGIYGRAYHLMAGPAVLFGNVLDRVLFPTMVHVQNQPQRLALAYQRGIALIALVILPISAIVVALAPEVVYVLLGPEWSAVVAPLQILGVGMLFRTSCKISDSLVRATGAVYLRSWRQLVYAIFVIVGSLIGQFWGVEGVSVAVLVTLGLNFLLMAHLALYLTKMTWRRFAAAHLPGFALAALSGGSVAVAAQVLRAGGAGPLLTLILALAAALPSVIAVVCFPKVFLGENGEWMVHKLMSLILGSKQSDSADRTEVAGQESSMAGMPIVALTQRLAAEGIHYCRWKSRVNLERVLSGKGDLDLLVARSDADAFLRVAEEVGFKRLFSCFGSSSTKELHLYALDRQTGALLHLHVNITLLGAARLSSPLEVFLLQNCAPASEPDLLAGMPVIKPHVELLVYVLRAMEQYARLRAFPRLAISSEQFDSKLRPLVTSEALESWPTLLKECLPNASPTEFGEFLAALQQPTRWYHRFRLARRLQDQLTRAVGMDFQQPSIAPVVAAVNSAAPKASRFKALCWRLGGGRGSPKQLPDGGKVIAFVGPDASGKSTMVSESANLLGKVFRISGAHLGKPPSTWLTLLPNVAGRTLGKVAPRMRTFHQRPVQAGSSSRGQGLLYRIRAVLLAWDRRALALRLARKAAQGWLVICDRYPTACVGAPDSARLRKPEDEPGLSWFRACLARLENRLYRDIPDPNIVIRLSSPVGLALDRNRQRDKPGKEGDDFVARRHSDFFMPPFGRARIIVLDTSTSREESVQSLRHQLWDGLCWPQGHHTSPPSPPAPTRDKRISERMASLPLLNGSADRSVALHQANGTLVVEFIGVTGVGKSTLISAVMENLPAIGLRGGLAEEVILSYFGLGFVKNSKARSMLVFALSLPSFVRYFFTREGAMLSRLAFCSIGRGMNNLWVGANLVRNFIKRIGSHLLLEDIRDEVRDWDIVIWDEGAVHSVHNLFVHSKTEPRVDDIVEFGNMVPRPELLIWVTAPTSQSARVILRRGHSRVETTDHAANSFSERAQKTFEVLSSVHELRDRIYRIDNGAKGPDLNVEAIRSRASAICEFLAEQLQPTHETPQREGAPLCLIA